MSRLLACWLFSLAAVTVAMAGEGYLQINAQPGTRVFVDGIAKGETVMAPAPADAAGEDAAAEPDAFADPAAAPAAEGAAEPDAAEVPAPTGFLVVGPLAAGPHIVRTERSGQPARTTSVEVETNALVLLTVPEGDAPIEIVEDGTELELPEDEAKATLEIVTLPAESFIQIGDGEPVAKSKPLWTAAGVAVGDLNLSVVGADGTTLPYTVTMKGGATVRLLADLQIGVVRNLTDQEMADAWFTQSREKSLTLADEQVLLWHPAGVFLAEKEVTAGDWQKFVDSEASAAAAVKGTAVVLAPSPAVAVAAVDPTRAAGISYQQATEYCRWLTLQARAVGDIPPGWAFRLPTHDEWLAAVQTEKSGWQKLIGGVAEWVLEDQEGWVVALGGSDLDRNPLARGTNGTPGRRARPNDRLPDVGLRLTLAPDNR